MHKCDDIWINLTECKKIYAFLVIKWCFLLEINLEMTEKHAGD